MPRLSVAGLSIVPASAPGALAPAPKELSPAEARLWEETVASKPADWFGPDNYPLLKEYCRAAVMCDTLARQARAAVRKKDAATIKLVLDMRDKEAKRAASLGTKLRLTQQSKYTPQAAATADRRVKGGRPWQSAG